MGNGLAEAFLLLKIIPMTSTAPQEGTPVGLLDVIGVLLLCCPYDNFPICVIIGLKSVF